MEFFLYFSFLFCLYTILLMPKPNIIKQEAYKETIKMIKKGQK